MNQWQYKRGFVMRVSVKSESKNGIPTFVIIDGKVVHRIKTIDFSVGINNAPTFTFATIGIPDIDVESDSIKIEPTPTNIEDACLILKIALERDNSFREAFKASILSAIDDNNKNALPFEPDDTLANKIIDRIIGL